MKTLRLAAALGALVLSLAAPAAAVVTAGSGTAATLDAGFANQDWAGSFDVGRLDLVISSEGVVSGHFRPLDGNVQIVTGGLEGNRIWLDLGASPHRRIVGTYENGRIAGSVLGTGLEAILFSATPASSS